MRILLCLPAGAKLVISTACGQVTQVAAAPKPLEILVAGVEQKDVPLYREWIGALDGFINAEIKAEVSGCFMKQEYTERLLVRRGELLLPIDARPFRTELEQAEERLARSQGQLAQACRRLVQAVAEVAVAEVNQHCVQLSLDRYTLLFQRHGTAEQDLDNLDNSTKDTMAAAAAVRSCTAAIETEGIHPRIDSARLIGQTSFGSTCFSSLRPLLDGVKRTDMHNQLPVIYVVRHGDTAWTITGQHTGLTDLPLTSQGEDHARGLRDRLKDMAFAKVLTSPLQRARATCALAGFGSVAEIENGLVEWDYGKYEGLRSVEIHAERPDWDLFRDGAPGGESPAQVAERADNVWRRVRTMRGNILLFSSGHFIRVLAARWIGLEPSCHCNSFVLGTTSLSTFGYDLDVSRPVIQLWNDMHHVSAA